MTVGQVCVRPLQKAAFYESDNLIDFDLKLTLPKDSMGFVRRDVQEEKEKQVQDLVKSKLLSCIDL